LRRTKTIGKLVDQIAAVTQTAKEIEAKISGDVWSRQKRWEVQQTALLGTLRDLAAAADSDDVDQSFRSDGDQCGAKRRRTFSV
jgi:cytochrome c556